MKRMWVSYEGQLIEAGHIVEKLRDTIKEKMGICIDDLSEYEALNVAAQATNKTIPELLGI